MRAAARVDWRLHVLGGAEHAFHHPSVNPDGSLATEGPHRQTVRPGVGYHHAHAQRTWRDLLGLLDEAFGWPGAGGRAGGRGGSGTGPTGAPAVHSSSPWRQGH